jgi:hypothetical protein
MIKGGRRPPPLQQAGIDIIFCETDHRRAESWKKKNTAAD